jgi:ATP-binding cassette subfamily F protein 3
VKTKAAPKVNKQENKKLRATLVQERSKATSHLKKEVEKLENFIVESEEMMEIYHADLITASNKSDNSKIMEVSQLISKTESEIEKKFELLEVAQNSLDDILKSYDEKIAELEG